MENISIVYLEKNPDNIKAVSKLILKDTSNKCFVNKDEYGNIIPLEYMAEKYLTYCRMFGINYKNKMIGLLSFNNRKRIGIFIEPDYQGQGLGKRALKIFEIILRERYKFKTIYAEVTTDNIECMKLLETTGYIKTDETRKLPINGVYVKTIKYQKEIDKEKEG